MNLLRLYVRTLRVAGIGSPAGLDAGARQRAAGGRAVRRAGAVRPHHRRAGRRAGQEAPRRPGPTSARCSAPGSASGCSPSSPARWIALHADRLSHRRRHAVLTNYFEHVLQLPLSYHGGTHSGRLMKVMITGTDSLWWLWLGFFREHFAALVSLIVLLPLSLFLNWRLALLLIVLCVVFTALTALVIRKAEAGQTRGRAALLRSRGAHLRRARQRRAGAELLAHRGRGDRRARTSSPSCSARRCRCCRGGRSPRC